MAVADVAGHGQAVSDIGQWLYDSLEARMASLDGDLMLSDLNQLAVERGISAMTTGAIASFHGDNSNAVYFSYAGHHPMLIHRGGEPRWQKAELDDVTLIALEIR